MNHHVGFLLGVALVVTVGNAMLGGALWPVVATLGVLAVGVHHNGGRHANR